MKLDPSQSMTILQYLALIHQVSYTKVCQDLGMTPQQFSDWVKKRRPVPKERLHAVADYFQVKAELLVDDNHYLLDLTSDSKVDIQILFLQQLLEKADEDTELDGYREKLASLQKEKEELAQIARFAAIVKNGNERTRRVCEAFLDQLESSNEEWLEQFLNQKGS